MQRMPIAIWPHLFFKPVALRAVGFATCMSSLITTSCLHLSSVGCLITSGRLRRWQGREIGGDLPDLRLVQMRGDFRHRSEVRRLHLGPCLELVKAVDQERRRLPPDVRESRADTV